MHKKVNDRLDTENFDFDAESDEEDEEEEEYEDIAESRIFQIKIAPKSKL